MSIIEVIKTVGYKMWKHRVLVGFFLILFFCFWINTFHTRFPDEFDNIVGGWYINHGSLPYIGFFSHHNPGAYYIASIITLFSRQSFVVFREIWAVVLFMTISGSYWYLRRSVGEKETRFFLVYMILAAVSATYYWGQMILSETIVGHLFVPAFALVFLKFWYKKDLTLKDILFISVTTSLSLFTSMTFLFAIGAFLAFVVYRFVFSHGIKNKKTVKALLLLIFPYVLFGGYLIVTGSVKEFYVQSILYNRDYYIYNFPIVSGKVSTHPVRYVISIFYNTTNQFQVLLHQVNDFNFAYPVNLTLALVNVSVVVFLLSKRRYSFAIVYYLMMIYLNARSEPLNSGETDFHSTVYIMFSLMNFSLFFVLVSLELEKKLNYLHKMIYTSLILLVSIYGFFTVMFFGRGFWDKAYTKFMGQAPGIYDEAVVAPFINKIVSKEEYFWIGPFEFQELLYINGKRPSKYHWFLPANVRSEKIKTEIVADLLKNRPKLVVFKEDFGTFGVIPQDFNYPIVNILREHYFRLGDIDPEFKIYEVRNKDLHNFDIWTNFYFDKNRKDEIIELLLREQIIERKTV